MALKKYIKINGWDALDSFYGKKVNGVHLVIETFDRVFCRCGETHASEGGIVHKCPKCGNTDFIEYETNSYYWGQITDKYKYVADDSLCPLRYNINATKLEGEVGVNREAINFNISEHSFVQFDEDNIQTFDIPSTRTYYHRETYSTRDISKDLIKAWPHFPKYEKMLDAENLGLTIDNLQTVCKKVKEYGNCLNDPLYIQYPYLGKTVLNKVLEDERRSTSAKLKKGENFSYYLNAYDIDKEFLSVYDYYQKKNKDSSYRNIFQNVGRWNDSYPLYKKIQMHKKDNTRGYKIVEKFILNGMVDLDDSCQLIKNIDELFKDNPTFDEYSYEFRRSGLAASFKTDFDEETLSLIDFYIKENITLKNSNTIVFDFLKDVKTLRELKIKVCEENLKVKNMNYYLNKFRLAETYKLPPDKIECFIDWFEKNPLKAVQLIENRRKVTKKQLDVFLKEMMDD